MQLKAAITNAFNKIDMAHHDHYFLNSLRESLRELGLSLESKLQDVEESFGTLRQLQVELSLLDESLFVSTTKILEHYENDIKLVEALNVQDSADHLWERLGGINLRIIAFMAIRQFSNLNLYELRYWLYPESDADNGLFTYEIKSLLHDLSRGVAEAIHIYLQAGSNASNEKPESAPKIIWLGTPGEFGAIFKTLAEQGYVTAIGNNTKNVRFLLEHFKISQRDGESVSVDYLAKCFNEKVASYNPNELKIPLSAGTTNKNG